MRVKVKYWIKSLGIIFLLLFVSPFYGLTQNMAPEGLIPSGGSGKSPEGSIDYSFGQLFFEPLSNAKASVMVGLQQPEALTVSITSYSNLYCYGDTGTVIVNGPKGYVLKWKLEGGLENVLNFAGLPTPIYVGPLDKSTKIEFLTLTNPFTLSETKVNKSHSFVVLSVPKPQINISDTSICAFNSLKLTNLPFKETDLIKLKWKLGNQVTQEGNDWDATFDREGNFKVTVLATVGGLCPDSSVVNIRVSNPPSLAELSARDNEVFCEGDTIKLIGEGTRYSWYRNNKIMSGDTLPFLILKKDTAEFQGEIWNLAGCSLKTGVVPIRIRGGILKPSLSLVGNKLINLDSAKGYKEIKWYLNSNIIKDSMGQSLLLTNFGKYNLLAKDTLGCLNVSNVYEYEAKYFDSLLCSKIKLKPERAQKGVSYKGSLELPYENGNGGVIKFDTIRNAADPGMILYLTDSKLRTGDGSLKFEITGKATNAGILSYDINLGGKSCSVELPVEGVEESISTLPSFTPNNDGINDLWQIPELRDQPDVKVIIFDREGMKVYEMPGNGGWDGTNIGIPLPSADYWFMIQYPAALSKKPQIGHFTLLR